MSQQQSQLPIPEGLRENAEETRPERLEMYTQLKTLEGRCLKPWLDPTTGELPKDWWPTSIEMSYGDQPSSCYSLEFSGHRNWSTHSYLVALSGFQHLNGSWSDLKATAIDVSDQAAPQVQYADEDVTPAPDQDQYILAVYSEVLQTLLDPHQEGVRIEVRFATVRNPTDPYPPAPITDLNPNRTLHQGPYELGE